MATRPHPRDGQLGTPLQAKPCTCLGEPAADPDEMTCWRCGHQVGGAPMPTRVVLSLGASFERMRKRPRYRGAP